MDLFDQSLKNSEIGVTKQRITIMPPQSWSGKDAVLKRRPPTQWPEKSDRKVVDEQPFLWYHEEYRSQATSVMLATRRMTWRKKRFTTPPLRGSWPIANVEWKG
ncbi:MAG: hypothetical protein HQL91_00630 [Magnetococcales bacterium]|nr:hypothetical protein [Magnetococcales bacterium]